MFNDRLPYDDEYGVLDPMLGDLVLVNGVNLYEYNADLIEYEPVVASITYDVYSKVGKHSYILNKFANGKNGIKLRFYVGGQNAQQAQVNCNKVIGMFQSDIVTLVIGDTEFEYSGIMSAYTIKHTEVFNYYLLEITFVAVKRLPYIIDKEEVVNNKEIHVDNQGVVSCGAIIVLESNLSSKNVTLVCNSVSVTINNFNSYKYHVIDGLNGRVLCGTSNADIDNDLVTEDFTSYINNFGNTNLVEFPYMNAGDNCISVSDYNCVNNIFIKYYPIFII